MEERLNTEISLSHTNKNTHTNGQTHTHNHSTGRTTTAITILNTSLILMFNIYNSNTDIFGI